jgi:hypothetical protein
VVAGVVAVCVADVPVEAGSGAVADVTAGVPGAVVTVSSSLPRATKNPPTSRAAAASNRARRWEDVMAAMVITAL